MKKIINITAFFGLLSLVPAHAAPVLPGSGFDFGAFATTGSLSQNSLIFFPNPGYASIGSATGSFSQFAPSASNPTGGVSNVQSVIQFEPTLQTTNPFMDVGNFFDNPLIGGSGATLNDGLYSFHLYDANYVLGQSDLGFLTVTVDLIGALVGDELGNTTAAQGVITLQNVNMNLATAQGIINNGGTLSNLTFSGATIATNPVPEPSTYAMFGTAFAILGFVGYRKRRA